MSEIFEKYSSIVDKHKDYILKAERYLYSIPETGYKEFKTTKYAEDEFEKLGYEVHRAEGITGFYADIDTGRPGPKVLIFGELDSVICRENEMSDKETGAVHACGHNCQMAALLGIAAALKEEGALDGLSGSVRLCGVPAEELLETEYREELRKKGIINYYGGKIEFLYRGYFDDVDLAFMVHTTSGEPHTIRIQKCSNGLMSKNIVFKGVAAHAGGSPQNGVNALYAANVGINAVNALRETIVDGMYGRIHSIMTKGGQMVNAIPSEVCLESQIRGHSNEFIKNVNDKVNRAYAAAAASMGARLEIHDRPGYSPVENDENLLEIFKKTALMCTDPEKVKYVEVRGGGCSDIGDIQCVIPTVHPYVSGASGTSHGADYRITDPESACVFSAKYQLVSLYELLKDNASEAYRVIKNAKLRYSSKEEYFAAIDSFNKDKEAVIYNENGTVTLDF